MQSEPVYDTLSLKLQAGERLLLFTDGLFDGAMTGSNRKALEMALLAAAGDSPRDDATLVILESVDP